MHKILNFSFIAFLVINLLIIGLLYLSLWGSLSFWQPGAERGFQRVTLRGMYPDLHYHENSANVEYAILHHGLFTYTIDCKMMDGGIRTGAPTFAWWQFSILILIIINVWMITKFLLSRKASVSERKVEI